MPYNETLKEGMEEALDLLHETIQHTPLELKQTHGTEYDKGYIDYQDMVVSTVKELEPKFKSFLTTFAEKIREEIRSTIISIPKTHTADDCVVIKDEDYDSLLAQLNK